MRFLICLITILSLDLMNVTQFEELGFNFQSFLRVSVLLCQNVIIRCHLIKQCKQEEAHAN